MSKVITFSTQFPSYHPKKGQPTYFVEKIWKSLGGVSSQFTNPFIEDDITKSIVWGYQMVDGIKYHTIRAGKRWKAGDVFSPRIWSGKPYNSPQIQIAPEVQIKKVWDIGLRIRGDFKEFYCNDCDLTHTSIAQLAINDGLAVEDLFSWFNKPMEGQIICWNQNINY